MFWLGPDRLGYAIFMWLLFSLSLEDQSRGDISAVADFLPTRYIYFLVLHFSHIFSALKLDFGKRTIACHIAIKGFCEGWCKWVKQILVRGHDE